MLNIKTNYAMVEDTLFRWEKPRIVPKLLKI